MQHVSGFALKLKLKERHQPSCGPTRTTNLFSRCERIEIFVLDLAKQGVRFYVVSCNLTRLSIDGYASGSEMLHRTRPPTRRGRRLLATKQSKSAPAVSFCLGSFTSDCATSSSSLIVTSSPATLWKNVALTCVSR